ncbi:hypothetical protein DFH08DRAFT_979348 [Mycena albidolilacea]|uniref:F-box domain-containing protein n=1 Tax=Mycena albidolilacea TaxID=1033008 RepID=A0AAD6YWV6_9AGAR|nr:hypothetical protein DFH08DRAFT_979348 [Mycena albidolilacea]
MNRLPPISSLPTELLLAIVVAGQEDCVPNAFKAAFKPEWTLSQTSSRFREAIIGTRALWTLVEANLADAGSVKVAKIYLERSRACKVWANLYRDIDNSKNFDTGVEDAEHALIAERFHSFIPHMNRIWRLRIVINTFQIQWVRKVLFSSLHTIAAPSLEHLEVINDAVQYYHMHSLYPLRLFSCSTPRLTFAHIVGFIPLPMPWMAHLTQLELGRTAAIECRFFGKIAAQCSSLVHLYLDLRNDALTEDRFHIPTLTSLDITIADGEEDDILLSAMNAFDAPALTEFTIHNADGCQLVPLFDPSNPRHTSFPALASLCLIKRYPCSCEEREPITSTIPGPPIAVFPALSSLTLINQCWTANILDDILGPGSQPASADPHAVSPEARVAGRVQRAPNRSAFENPVQADAA